MKLVVSFLVRCFFYLCALECLIKSDKKERENTFLREEGEERWRETLLAQHIIWAVHKMLPQIGSFLYILSRNRKALASFNRLSDVIQTDKIAKQSLKRVEKRKLSCDFTVPLQPIPLTHSFVRSLTQSLPSSLPLSIFPRYFCVCSVLFCFLRYIMLSPKTIASIVLCSPPKISHCHYKPALYDP